MSEGHPCPFENKKNIRFGAARLMYGTATIDRFNVAHPAGWVLPGGKRTSDETEAYTAIKNLDKLLAANGA